MDAGTKIREEFSRGDMLALLAVSEIRERRERITKDPDKPAPRHAYIIRSVKHPAEISALRDIYGRLFVGISIYAPRHKRVEALAKRIAESNNSTNVRKYIASAENLVTTDELEEGKKLGQDVTDAFPLADFFVSTANRQAVNTDVHRFIEILFGYPFHTPSPDEVGMQLAGSAALRSADLSRQVGAVIWRTPGEVISIGCNEVPAFGGGFYWPNHGNDHRDFVIGFDSSTRFKDQIVKQVIDRLYHEGFFNADLLKQPVDKLAEQMLSLESRGIFAGTQIFDLLEFGRPVHAEMAAISDAARRGIAIEQSTLFSTTFPCHMCARHIISSGIKRVVYIYPYPKSRVKELYGDSVCVEGEGNDGSKVDFVPFVGVSPRRYAEFFEALERKDAKGNAKEWQPAKSEPRVKRLVYTYIELEKNILVFVDSLVTRHQWKLV